MKIRTPFLMCYPGLFVFLLGFGTGPAFGAEFPPELVAAARKEGMPTLASMNLAAPDYDWLLKNKRKTSSNSIELWENPNPKK